MDFKEMYYSNFIIQKLAFQKIHHKKIVHNIVNKYSQLKAVLKIQSYQLETIASILPNKLITNAEIQIDISVPQNIKTFDCLSHLIRLDLQLFYNFSFDEGEENFYFKHSKQIEKLTQLKSFNISIFGFCEFNEQKAKSLFNSIQKLSKNLQNLQISVLHNNPFGPQAIQYMMNCVSKLEKLVSFDLVIGENNSVGIEGSKIIGKGLMQLKNLISLGITMHSNNIQPEGAIALEEGYSQLSQLQFLDIDIRSFNNIGTSIQGNNKYFGYNLQNMKSLKQLDLNISEYNISENEVYRSIGKGLQGIPQLQILNFDIQGYNKIGVDGCESIGEGLSSLVNLVELNLEFGVDNQIHSQGIKFIIEGIKKIVKLKEFSFCILEKNVIFDRGAGYIAKYIKELHDSERITIIIKQNKITEKGAECIGTSLLGLNKLKNVYIEFNKSNVANKLIKNMFKVSEKGGKGYELSDRIYP